MKKVRLIITVLFSCFSLLALTQSRVGVKTINPQQTFHIDGSGDNPLSGTASDTQLSNDVLIDQNGKLGIGLLPQYKLDIKTNVKGAGFRLEDGNERDKKVLTSDYQGNATWQYLGALPIITGVLSTSRINIPITTTGWIDTGSYITLPPGKWSVHVIMLLRMINSIEPKVKVSSTFFPSSDIIGAYLFTGIAYDNINSTLMGFIIINNTSGASKTYRLNVGSISGGANGASAYLYNFGGDFWGEDNIVAYQLLQ